MMLRSSWLFYLSISFVVTTSYAKPVVVPTPESVQSEVVEPITETQGIDEILVAEIALQRHHSEVTLALYSHLTAATHQADIAQRAVELSLYSRNADLATKNLQIWLESDPGSRRAQELLSALTLSKLPLTLTGPVWQHFLDSDESHRANDLQNLSILLLAQPDRAGALTLAQDISQRYPKVVEGHLLVAQQAMANQNWTLATEESNKALALQPDNENAAILHAQILNQQGTKLAQDYLEDYLQQYPKALSVRLALARLFIDQNHYDGALKQFDAIQKAQPNNPDLLMAMASLQIQLKNADAALDLVRQAQKLGYQKKNAAWDLMGQAYDLKEDWPNAISQYQQIQDGNELNPARVQQAIDWAHLKEANKAFAVLDAWKTSTDDEFEQKALAKELVWRDLGQDKKAYEALSQALQQHPDSAAILYDHALLADKLGDLSQSEKDLRLVIQLKPDYAPAYNALGYGYADHGVHLEEAESLIDKALSLAPNDPAILDSKGWVEYRLGHLQEAQKNIQQSFAIQQDPEVAAHLGEVLWKEGLHDEAIQAWDSGIKLDQKNELLLKTRQHFEKNP